MRKRFANWRFIREGHAWHGLQLVLSVMFAYAAAAGLNLPERHWAVMSALIVSRADSTATLSAGWQRLGATLSGAIVGVIGVGLVELYAGSVPVITLVIVAALSFVTADRVGWRTAPITALIVMSAVGRPGEVSALAVAGLRTLEVGVGAIVAMGVAWLAYHLMATIRPLAVVSSLLQELAAQVDAAAAGDTAIREARSATVRATVRRLGEMVHGSRDIQRRKLLQLAMRLTQDAGWLVRQITTTSIENIPRAQLAAAGVSTALQAVAKDLHDETESSRVDIALLSKHTGALWQADAVLILQDDIRKLVHVATTGTKPKLTA